MPGFPRIRLRPSIDDCILSKHSEKIIHDDSGAAFVLQSRFRQRFQITLEFTNWLSLDSNRTRGEFVLIIHAPDVRQDTDSTHYSDILQILLSELSLKGSVKLAQLLTGAPKNELYELALALSKKTTESDTTKPLS